MSAAATARHAVISGAGVAGPALAHGLTSRGWQVTVIERFPEPRAEGQNVDIRGAAREVIRRMGIDDAVRAANTGEIGTRFLRPDGSTAATFPVAQHGEPDGPTAELEILRGELSRILIDTGGDGVAYRFGTTIDDITDHGRHVTATLNDGTSIDADLVVIAEGLRSRSRRFVVATEVNDFGMYFAYATLPRRPADSQWWEWQSLTGSRSVHLRPDNVGTTRAILTFFSDVRGLEDLDRAGQLTILRRTFADAGSAAARVLADLEDGAPMYFSVLGRVRSPVWSKGRIALLGDAAFCNATFGGVGTSLALIGAYIMAGELAATEDTVAALARYQVLMRPFVNDAPSVRESVLRLANPRSRNGIRLFHAALRMAASPMCKKLATLVSRRPVGTGDDGRLPTYPT